MVTAVAYRLAAQRKQIDAVLAPFLLSLDTLREVKDKMRAELEYGLKRETQASATVKMLPTYVCGTPDGTGNFISWTPGGARKLPVCFWGRTCQLFWKMPGGVLLANQCFLQHFLAGPLAPNLRKWEHKCKCHRGQCSCRCVAEYGIQTCCKKHQNEILLLQRVESSLPWILVGQISEFCWSKLEAGGGDPCRCTTKSLPFLWRSCKGQGKR